MASTIVPRQHRATSRSIPQSLAKVVSEVAADDAAFTFDVGTRTIRAARDVDARAFDLSTRFHGDRVFERHEPRNSGSKWRPCRSISHRYGVSDRMKCVTPRSLYLASYRATSAAEPTSHVVAAPPPPNLPGAV